MRFWFASRLSRRIAALAALACVLAAAGCGKPRAADEFSVYFLSVGHGDAALLGLPGGRWAMVDAGPADGPVLRGPRIGAAIFDAGVEEGGQRAYVIAGGAAPPGAMDPTSADRIVPGDGSTVALTGTYAHAAALDGGAVLTVDGSAASVIAPTAAAARPTALAPAFTAGLRMIGLEDGHVLGVGGAANGDVALYDPTSDRWELAAPAGEAT